MSTYDLAHRFFHEPNKTGEYARLSTSFQYYETHDGELVWRYYSYSTCIAEIRKNKRGEFCLLISDYNYSHTTSKHLYELRRACPFGYDRIIKVPRVDSGFYFGDYGHIKGTYDFERKLKAIHDMTDKDLRRQENRFIVIRDIDMYDTYVAAFGDTNKEEKRLRKSAKVAKVIAITNEKNKALEERRNHVATPEEIAKRVAKRDERKAKERERIKRKLDEFLGEGNSLSKLQAVFKGRRYYHLGLQYYYDDIADGTLIKAMSEYRKMLDDQRDSKGRSLSYVWLDAKGNAETSQHCQAPREDVIRLLTLWKHKQDIVGKQAGVYTVVENTEESVKVGCHVIPIWNVELLCEALNVA